MGSNPPAALGGIAHYAESSPHAPALIVPDGPTLNYGEFWAQIEELSNRLQEACIGVGERVAILLPQGALQVIAVTGVLNRHLAVPLQSKTTVAEVESWLRGVHASALIVSPEFEPHAMAALRMGLIVLVARNGEPPKNWQIRSSLSHGNAYAAGSDGVLILVTSATTGSSKLVPLTVANLNAGSASTRDAAQLTASDRLLLMVSLCHRNGVENAFAQFFVGGAVIATDGFDPLAYLHWLNDLRPTWYLCSPTMHQASLAQIRNQIPREPISLRFVQSSGAPLPAEVGRELELVLRVPVLNAYGATEAHHIAVESCSPNGRVANSAGRSCGSEIGIMDPYGTFFASDEEGEIVVRGPAVFSGYLDNPEANAAAFYNGWFRTGDVGRLDSDGNLFVTGRLKEIINRGGEKIIPDEVDAVMMSHSAVLEAATFSVPHATLGEDVACAVVLRSALQTPVSIGELRRYAAERLARFKLPSRIFFVDEIPRGELGKPQRWVLRERLSGKRSGPPSPDVVTQQSLDDAFFRSYEIWARILGRDDLGYDENFFDAGGDSLSAINMLAEVDLRMGSACSKSAGQFLDEPTIATVRELMGKQVVPNPSQSSSREIKVFPIHHAGTKRKLFCVPADGEEGLYFHRLATHLKGQIDVLIVRPENTWHTQSIFTFEHAGAMTAKQIRQVQPEGPYLVGGYCYGGVVAVEAARQLTREGHVAKLVLFDVLMPGFPSPLRQIRTWLASARRERRLRRNNEHMSVVMTMRCIVQPLLWYALVPFRRLLSYIEHFPAVQWFLRPIQGSYFPLYKMRPLDAPILHFQCTDVPNPLDLASRSGWKTGSSREVSEQLMAFDHANLFHESNLTRMVETLLHWSET